MRVAVILLVAVAVAAVLSDRLPATATTTPDRSQDRVPTVRSLPASAPDDVGARDVPAAPPAPADPGIPDGTTVFDEDVPGVANLDPDLLSALRDAAADAADDGVAFQVDSGWRSTEHQQRLLDEAIAQYGSAEEAARWVAPPELSAHVSGDAVDIGPDAARTWLARHGATYGLCQIYANEPWHFELRPDATAQGCPATYPDPTHDPRLHR